MNNQSFLFVLAAALLISAATGPESALAFSLTSSSSKKECPVYSGDKEFVWRNWTIRPGDVIDLNNFPAEIRVSAYSELYLGLLRENKITIVDCTNH